MKGIVFSEFLEAVDEKFSIEMSERLIDEVAPFWWGIYDIGDLRSSRNCGFGDQVIRYNFNFCCRSIKVARFGGEEFCFLFAETGVEAAAIKAEKIREAISLLNFECGEQRFSMTVSIGVSHLLQPNDSLEGMLKRSDESLYRVKENGRNGVGIWED